MFRTTLILTDNDVDAGRVDSLVSLASGEAIPLRGGVLFLGAGAGCHIQAEDPYLSQRQALLARDRTLEWHVFHDSEAKNPTLVNGIAVRDQPDFIALYRGAIIRAGRSAWIASDSKREERDRARWYIAAQTEAEFRRCALLVYGSFSAAAKAIGAKLQTYRDHLERDSSNEPQTAALLEHFAGQSGRKRKRHNCPALGVPVTAMAFPPDRVLPAKRHPCNPLGIPAIDMEALRGSGK